MSDWKQRSIERRDFRHMHDEPEVPRWRKKGKKHDRARCDHQWSQWESRNWSMGYRPKTTTTRSDGYRLESERSFEYEMSHCTKCKKRKARTRTISKQKHYHWDKVFFENEYVSDWKYS